MEIIELNQKHNLELQRQHDEFEDKYSSIKNELEEKSSIIWVKFNFINREIELINETSRKMRI